MQAQNFFTSENRNVSVWKGDYYPSVFYLPAAFGRELNIALETNLIYDIALLPNFTAENYLSKGLSLAIENIWSWWSFGKPIQKSWYHRIQAAGAELRCWINSSHPLNGHAVEGYTLFGDYDDPLFPKDGYFKGWLSYGSWSAGLLYISGMPIKEWAQRVSYNRQYFDPMRAGISLVWLLGTGNNTRYR